ncbi:hypothetical protein [Gordonia hankookensis]|uniref:Transposase n=1 Tax=Gordonia hankookensis TaxID=589403 RepID=A0ABR7WAX8_9ACTN|nr:hypothetical protein [Gordonia hankookensis]MBD1319770.1 hypothetical protein [Gordonia hankookensis]
MNLVEELTGASGTQVDSAEELLDNAHPADYADDAPHCGFDCAATVIRERLIFLVSVTPPPGRTKVTLDTSGKLGKLTAFETWNSSAGDAARGSVGKTRKHLDRHGEVATRVADVARRAEGEISQVKESLKRLRADIAKIAAYFTSKGIGALWD